LAAGEGKRLRPFTVNKPKAMLSIAGKPTLQYVVESLAQNGIRDLVIVVGYRREHIFDYIGSGERFGVNIRYINQEKQIGTADALLQAEHVVNHEFIVSPGDKLIEPDTIAGLKDMEPNAILVKKLENPVRSSVITVDEEGVIKEAMRSERRAVGTSRETGIFMVNTGIYAFAKEIFSFIKDEQSIPVALNKMLVKGREIKAVETKGIWLDITYPWDILNLNNTVLQGIEGNMAGTTEANVSIKGAVSLSEKTVIRANSSIFGPVVIGRGCEIGPNVCIMPSTSIGDNVTISPFTQIKNSVIGSDVSIGPSSIIQDSVIDKDCVVEGYFAAISGDAEVKIDKELRDVKAGAMIGEGCRLGSHVVAQPGVVIGNYSQIKPLNTISGQVPDKSIVI